MSFRFKNTDLLTPEKVLRNFKYQRARNVNSGFYFAEVIYDGSDKFYDLYIKTDKNVISQNQIEIFNNLNKNLTDYIKKVDAYLITTLSGFEQKKAMEIKSQKLNIDVLEIQEDNKNFDSVLVCGKQYKYLGLFKKDVGIRIELKNGKIVSILRKKDTTKEN